MPARRDAAPEPGQLPDADRHEGQPHRDRRRRPAGGRLRLPARPRRRRRRPRGPRRLHRGLRGDCDRRGRVSLRHSDHRDDGPQLHPLVPDRRRGVRRVPAPPPRALDAPDRHPRSAGRRARRRGGVSRRPGSSRGAVRIDSGDLVPPDRGGAGRARQGRAGGDRRSSARATSTSTGSPTCSPRAPGSTASASVRRSRPSSDAPALGGVYKLVESRRPRQ